MRIQIILTLLASSFAGAALAEQYEYRVLATTKTSTMEREMNQAAAEGFAFEAVMGGETAFGGNEVALVMSKTRGSASSNVKSYKLLATRKTSTLQKELQEMGDEGFAYRGQTIFESTFGGREVSVILERDADAPSRRFVYLLLATSRTKTMQKELQEAGENGFELLGMTVGQTSFGGNELVCLLGKEE